ncbi:MAG: hypothetical protein IJ689_04460 [Alphaproteobacteria bacterium]|nr:hypothetical protein [Alphaproteobacteria bacterium]
MKKFIFILSLFISFSANAGADKAQDDSQMTKIRQETEKYKKYCYDNEAFPKGIDNYSFYNNDIKEGEYRYHQCLKKIIIQKIRSFASNKDAEKMIESLNKIQNGTLDYYWTLYNIDDFGVAGRMQNDAVMGRRMEDILEDTIHYQIIYGNN